MVAGISAISLCVMPRSVSIVIGLTNVKRCRTAPLRMCHGENHFRTSGADRDRTGDRRRYRSFVPDGVFAEDPVERFHQAIAVRSGKAERRLDLEHVVVRAVGAQQDATVPHPVRHVAGGLDRLPGDDGVDVQDACEDARAAIAKAKGTP